MGRLTITLPDELERQLRARARREQTSLSVIVSDLVKKNRTPPSDSVWAGQVAKIYGSWVGEFPRIDDPPLDRAQSPVGRR